MPTSYARLAQFLLQLISASKFASADIPAIAGRGRIAPAPARTGQSRAPNLTQPSAVASGHSDELIGGGRRPDSVPAVTPRTTLLEARHPHSPCVDRPRASHRDGLFQQNLSKGFTYERGNCDHQFSPSPVATALGPHRFGGLKLLRCPTAATSRGPPQSRSGRTLIAIRCPATAARTVHRRDLWRYRSCREEAAVLLAVPRPSPPSSAAEVEEAPEENSQPDGSDKKPTGTGKTAYECVGEPPNESCNAQCYEQPFAESPGWQARSWRWLSPIVIAETAGAGATKRLPLPLTARTRITVDMPGCAAVR